MMRGIIFFITTLASTYIIFSTNLYLEVSCAPVLKINRTYKHVEEPEVEVHDDNVSPNEYYSFWGISIESVNRNFNSLLNRIGFRTPSDEVTSLTQSQSNKKGATNSINFVPSLEKIEKTYKLMKGNMGEEKAAETVKTNAKIASLIQQSHILKGNVPKPTRDKIPNYFQKGQQNKFPAKIKEACKFYINFIAQEFSATGEQHDSESFDGPSLEEAIKIDSDQMIEESNLKAWADGVSKKIDSGSNLDEQSISVSHYLLKMYSLLDYQFSKLGLGHESRDSYREMRFLHEHAVSEGLPADILLDLAIKKVFLKKSVDLKLSNRSREKLLSFLSPLDKDSFEINETVKKSPKYQYFAGLRKTDDAYFNNSEDKALKIFKDMLAEYKHLLPLSKKKDSLRLWNNRNNLELNRIKPFVATYGDKTLLSAGSSEEL